MVFRGFLSFIVMERPEMVQLVSVFYPLPRVLTLSHRYFYDKAIEDSIKI